MTPADPQPDLENTESESATNHQAAGHGRWVLTTKALDQLLNHFSTDREEAGRHYEMMRVRLVRFFEWRSCISAEDLADETINRVARRIDEGETIYNLPAYFSTVARLVFMEWLRERERTAVPLEEIPEVSAEETTEDEQKNARLSCLDNCLDKLPLESRTLILKYYLDERRAKIDHRRQLAAALGIPMNALRIRAHRIRIALENCVRSCLTEPA